jgi:hypothetical protein
MRKIIAMPKHKAVKKIQAQREVQVKLCPYLITYSSTHVYQLNIVLSFLKHFRNNMDSFIT